MVSLFVVLAASVLLSDFELPLRRGELLETPIEGPLDSAASSVIAETRDPTSALIELILLVCMVA